MSTTLKEAISDFFAGRSRKSQSRVGPLPGKGPEGVPGMEGSKELTIRLLEPGRSPATPVERLVVETLKREGRTPLKKLAEHVARELYFEEVRSGAWVLDIGLFGPDLFVPDVASELKTGNGILWEIQRAKEQVNGILPDLS